MAHSTKPLADRRRVPIAFDYSSAVSSCTPQKEPVMTTAESLDRIARFVNGTPPPNDEPLFSSQPSEDAEPTADGDAIPHENLTPNSKPSAEGTPPVDREPTPNGTPPAPDPKPEPMPQTVPLPTEPPAKDRNAAGRFQPGCRPGPGNQFAKLTAALRKALLEAVTDTDIGRLGQKLLAQALDGDVVAAKLLLSYVVGRPGGAVDPDRLELDAVKLILAWPTASELLAGLSGVRPEVAAEIISNWLPSTSESTLEFSADAMHVAGSERIRLRRETKGK
jgi:hypothetical protein